MHIANFRVVLNKSYRHSRRKMADITMMPLLTLFTKTVMHFPLAISAAAAAAVADSIRCCGKLNHHFPLAAAASHDWPRLFGVLRESTK